MAGSREEAVQFLHIAPPGTALRGQLIFALRLALSALVQPAFSALTVKFDQPHGNQAFELARSTNSLAISGVMRARRFSKKYCGDPLSTLLNILKKLSR